MEMSFRLCSNTKINKNYVTKIHYHPLPLMCAWRLTYVLLSFLCVVCYGCVVYLV